MAKQKPNVLWLMTDEQRTDSLGCYGSPWAISPHLDQLAGEGIVFENAITPSPVCQPCRVSLLTGLYPSESGIWYNHNGTDNRELDHLVPLFAEANYRTASFGKHHYGSPNKAFQTEFEKTLSDEVDYFNYAKQYDPEKYNWVKYAHDKAVHPWILGGTFPEFMDRKSEALCVRNAIHWLEEHPTEQPFFLRLSFNGPHTPVVPPYPFDRLLRNEDIQYPTETEITGEGQPEWLTQSLKPFADATYLSREQIQEARRFYYGEAAFMDYQFGLLLDWMRKEGMLDNTIIAFVSDHGTHIGDYELLQKQTFYNPVVNVPYFFWYPSKIASGTRISTPVETRTLIPTLLELADIHAPDRCRSISLAQTLRTGKEPELKPVFSELTLGSFNIRHDDKLVMVRDGDWKLSAWVDDMIKDGALYNLVEDPYEQYNLFKDSKYSNEVTRLSDMLVQHLDQANNERSNME